MGRLLLRMRLGGGSLRRVFLPRGPKGTLLYLGMKKVLKIDILGDVSESYPKRGDWRLRNGACVADCGLFLRTSVLRKCLGGGVVLSARRVAISESSSSSMPFGGSVVSILDTSIAGKRLSWECGELRHRYGMGNAALGWSVCLLCYYHVMILVYKDGGG